MTVFKRTHPKRDPDGAAIFTPADHAVPDSTWRTLRAEQVARANGTWRPAPAVRPLASIPKFKPPVEETAPDDLGSAVAIPTVSLALDGPGGDSEPATDPVVEAPPAVIAEPSPSMDVPAAYSPIRSTIHLPKKPTSTVLAVVEPPLDPQRIIEDFQKLDQPAQKVLLDTLLRMHYSTPQQGLQLASAALQREESEARAEPAASPTPLQAPSPIDGSAAIQARSWRLPRPKNGNLLPPFLNRCVDAIYESNPSVVIPPNAKICMIMKQAIESYAMRETWKTSPDFMADFPAVLAEAVLHIAVHNAKAAPQPKDFLNMLEEQAEPGFYLLTPQTAAMVKAFAQHCLADHWQDMKPDHAPRQNGIR